MKIPLKYNIRNLLVRRTSTAMTVLGIAAVVAVFIGLNALSRGLQEAFVSSGEPDNVIVLRQGAQVETSSAVTRQGLHIIRYLDGIAATEQGEPLVSPEVVALVNLRRRADNEPANVLVRGLSPHGYALRQGLRLDTRTVEASPSFEGAPGSWHALAVAQAAGSRLFRGWWRRIGDHILSMVADPEAALPVGEEAPARNVIDAPEDAP